MNSSSNMIATHRYDLLPHQNKPELWFSYRAKFEAQADAKNILVILKDTYPEIPALRENAGEEFRIHHEKKLNIRRGSKNKHGL